MSKGCPNGDPESGRPLMPLGTRKSVCPAAIRRGKVPAMNDEDGYFDEQVAAAYDESSEIFEPGAVDATVEVLARLAGGGRALELGIGTGRIALPLARRGVAVHGIELSRAMVARMRAKPGGDAIGVT